MRTKLAALALTASLAGGGVALAMPSAFAADTTSSSTSSATGTSATDRAAARLTAIKDALKGLVGDGTITQAQADKVASTLSTSNALGGGGGHRGGYLTPDAVAAVLGITTDQLHTQREAGKTLTQIADAQGISKADLITRLVAAAKEQLAADVTAGKITQAQADTASSTLTADITKRVDSVRQNRTGNGAGTAPSSTASATPSAVTS